MIQTLRINRTETFKGLPINITVNIETDKPLTKSQEEMWKLYYQTCALSALQ